VNNGYPKLKVTDPELAPGRFANISAGGGALSQFLVKAAVRVAYL
jgi:hypothetical protein